MTSYVHRGNMSRFRSIVKASAPFVSLYLDDNRELADAQQRIAARWSAIHRHLEDTGVSGRRIADIEAAVLGEQPVGGSQGRAIVASADGALINESLELPPPATVLRVSDYPYLLPLLAAGRPTYVYAAVDMLGADLVLRRGRSLVRRSVEGDGYPVHKPATAGWHGYGDVAHSAEEAVRSNVRAVAAAITALADESCADVVFVCGEVRMRSEVTAELPHRIVARTVQLPAGARGKRASDDDPGIHELLDTELARYRRADVAATQHHFAAERQRASGLAVEGLGPVCGALRDGAVATLIVGDIGATTVVTGRTRTTFAVDADALSELGEAPSGVALADEVLPFAAVATDADVIRADDDTTLTEGVGALLRYPSRPNGQALTSPAEAGLPS